LRLVITFFKRGPADPSQQCKTASNSIQDPPPPRWILTIFKLKFGGGNLFSPSMTSTIEGNNSVGSLLKPLLKKVTPIVGSRMLWSPESCRIVTLKYRGSQLSIRPTVLPSSESTLQMDRPLRFDLVHRRKTHLPVHLKFLAIPRLQSSHQT
jgi:hypothetical protein